MIELERFSAECLKVIRQLVWFLLRFEVGWVVLLVSNWFGFGLDLLHSIGNRSKKTKITSLIWKTLIGFLFKANLKQLESLRKEKKLKRESSTSIISTLCAKSHFKTTSKGLTARYKLILFPVPRLYLWRSPIEAEALGPRMPLSWACALMIWGVVFSFGSKFFSVP